MEQLQMAEEPEAPHEEAKHDKYAREANEMREVK